MTDPKAMVEILRSQFEPIFTVPTNPVDIENILQDQGPRSLEDIMFTEDDIEASIMKIPPNSSPGLDGVSAHLLRNCAAELKRPIYFLWRTSMNTGRIPRCMKTSVVTPVFKGGWRGQFPG